MQYKDNEREMNGEMNLELSEVKSPEEFREYLRITQDAMRQSTNSENNMTQAIPAVPSQSHPSRSVQATATSRQVAAAMKICSNNGISPEDVARQYGVTSLKDVSSRDIWQYINDNTPHNK